MMTGKGNERWFQLDRQIVREPASTAVLPAVKILGEAFIDIHARGGLAANIIHLVLQQLSFSGGCQEQLEAG